MNTTGPRRSFWSQVVHKALVAAWSACSRRSASKSWCLKFSPYPSRHQQRVRHFHCDVRSPDKAESTAATVRAEIGHPTVIINNAGVLCGKMVLEAEPDGVRLMFNVNTLAHYWTTKAFLPNMNAYNYGMIVTVSSMAVWITPSNMVNYCASKAASMAFHEGLSAEITARYRYPRFAPSLCIQASPIRRSQRACNGL